MFIERCYCDVLIEMCFVFDEMYLLACLLGGVYWDVFCF